jgi:hypothetical protein
MNFHKSSIRLNKEFRLLNQVIFSIILCLSFVPNSQSNAQSEFDCKIYFPDQSSTTQPEYAILKCPFAGNEHDTVLVFDRGDDLQVSSSWQTSLDFENEIWIFDAKGDGTANLIIDFAVLEGQHKALLYDDQDNDRRVAYSIAQGLPVIKETKYPHVQVWAKDNWISNKQMVNYNLEIRVDGAARATFFDFSSLLKSKWSDGSFDFMINIFDNNKDGKPDYDIRQVLLQLPEGSGTKTEITVNTANSEAIPIQGYVFWPYLGGISGYNKPFGDAYAPIQIDWEKSKLVMVSEFVASRSGEDNWFTYSLTPFGINNLEYANFENPFAFYDLADDQDHRPELAIRNEYFDPRDPNFLQGYSSSPVETIRYTWDQNNDGYWDYKIDLLGRHPLTEVIKLPTGKIRSVPYHELPNWVMQNSWDSAHFVSTEGNPYYTSEGIYEGSNSFWRDYYITGFTDHRDMSNEVDISRGLRQEYSIELLQTPVLYFSPIDLKLHLKNSDGGVWNIDDQHRIRYQDLDKDGYLDQWTLTTGTPYDPSKKTLPNDTALQSINIAKGHAISWVNNTIRITPNPFTMSLFEIAPPASHEEWMQLSKKLDASNTQNFSSALTEIADRLSNDILTITNGKLVQFIANERGFQLYLDLGSDFDVKINLTDIDLTSITPGVYIIEYTTNDKNFTMTRIEVSSSRIFASPLVIDPEFSTTAEWLSIKLLLENESISEIKDLPIEWLAARDDLEPLVIARKTVNVPGNSSIDVSIRWWPSSPGKWRVWIEPDQEVIAVKGIDWNSSQPLIVDIKEAKSISIFHPLSGYRGAEFTLPVVIMLIAIGLAALSLFWLILDSL